MIRVILSFPLVQREGVRSVGFFTCTFCFGIFFRRLANFVTGFLGPCRPFLVMAVLLRHSTGHGAGAVE